MAWWYLRLVARLDWSLSCPAVKRATTDYAMRPAHRMPMVQVRASATFSWLPRGCLHGEELRQQLQPEPGVDLELDVLSPVMASRRHHWAGDVDREREQAQVRLEASLAWARQQGFVAKGEVGDPDAMRAIEDELRDFGADEVIIVTHPSERTTWLANRMLSHLKRQLEVPVREIVMGDEHDRSSTPSKETAG